VNSVNQTPAAQLELQRAIELHRAGRLMEAEQAYRHVLKHTTDPAIRFSASANLGVILQSQGRYDEAAECFRAALSLNPASAEAANSLGNALYAKGEPASAVACYRDAIRLRPQYAEAHYNLGNVLRQQGELPEAIAAFRRALAAVPGLPEAHNNLGNALAGQGDLDAAIDCYRQALALRPAYPEAYFNLGNAFKEQGRFDEANEQYRQAIAAAPNFAEAYNNLGKSLEETGRLEDAAVCFRQAIACGPRLPEAHLNLGNALARRGEEAAATAALREALAINPLHAEALASLVHCQQQICDWSGLADAEQGLRNAVKQGIGGIPPFGFNALSTSVAEQTACARLWASRIEVPDALKLPRRMPGANPKIRLGYLSSDFCSHATAHLVAELFERHDRAQFDVIGYSYGPDDDSDMRRRLVRGFDQFVDLQPLPFRAAAEQIHADAIDILIDLKGYTENSRSRILAFRPAPVQVNYLGFPGSMGADFIDYLIADPILAPMDQQPFCVESIVHLPDCFQPNDSRREISQPPPSRAACGLPDQGFVFCCFNNSYKIAPQVFDVWMRLLRAVPGSVLWLLEANAVVKDNLRREAVARGVAAERLVFASRLPLAAHLSRHAAADLLLDTLPVNALTTASDALWAGLPMITCLGETAAGRGGASLLAAIGLAELITASLQDYEALALKLAQEPARLLEIRGRLQRNRATAPLFDIARYTSNLEAAYRKMSATWRAGEAPAPFGV
jgi:protein O-GlcNAc transferase